MSLIFVNPGSEIIDADKQKFVDIYTYFNQTENVCRFVEGARNYNVGLGPSVSGEGTAICTESVYFNGRNSLLFRDGRHLYVLIQHNRFCSAIFVPDLDLVISNEQPGVVSTYVSHISEYLVENPSPPKNPRFLGIVMGYSRPYHYLYDRLPSVLLWRRRLGFIPIISPSTSAFLPAGKLFGDVEDVRVANVQRYVEERRGFVIDSGRTFGDEGPQGESRFRTEEAARVVHRAFAYSQRPAGIDPQAPLVWFGLCQEKRPWPEMAEAYASTITAILQKYPDAHFVFDGLTAPIGQTQLQFSHRVSNERAMLARIIALVGATFPFVDLIGAQASDKIGVASCVDYFISSALSDSNWCALLNRRPGIGYAANVSKDNRLIHPKTYILPKSLVSDADDGEANWALKGYSIRPEIVRDFTVLGLGAEISRNAQAGGLCGFFENPYLTEVSRTSYGGVRFGVKRTDKQDLVVGETGAVAEGPDSAQPLLARRYDFKWDLVLSRGVTARVLIEGLDPLGNVVERHASSRQFVDIRFGNEVEGFRVRLLLSGSGVCEYFGYRAQPIPAFLDAWNN